ncbi:helix-turn-helix domain-containing protein [Streptomyces sp. NPDC002680]|uniref:helix-turn-helix domain-containing protein n=1 Tax=Streptomyces sp. NPDC002680 TaxID=3364659 RepID=UPI003698848D
MDDVVNGVPEDVADESAQFGGELRRRRLAAGLSLADLAGLVHCSRGYLSRIENGHRRVTRELAEGCDDALDAKGELLDLAPESRADAPDVPPARTPGLRRATTPSTSGTVPAQPSRYGAEFDRLLHRGDTSYLAGRMEEADAYYRQAYQQGADNPEAQAVAVVRRARRWSDPGRVDHELLHLIRETLATLKTRDGAEAAGLRLRLGAHLAKKLSMSVSEDTAWPGAGPERGADLARRTLEGLATGGQDEETRCEVLTECRWGLYDFVPAIESLTTSLRLRDCALRARSPYFLGESLVALAIDQLRVGRVHGATGTVAEHRRHAARTRSTLARWQQCTLDTLLDLWCGRFDSATDWIFGESREIVASLEADLAVPADTLLQTRLGQVYWLLREQGRMAELFSSGLADGVERHGYFPVWRAGFALARCEVGDHDEAADRLLAFLRETADCASLPPHGWSVPALVLLAEVCAGLDAHGGYETELAHAVPVLREALARRPAGIALAGWPVVLVGPTERAMGLLALAEGDTTTALGHFRQAERLVVGSSPPQTARLRANEARALLREKSGTRRSESVALLRSALAGAEANGMRLLAAECRELLAAEGPPAGPQGRAL